MDVTKQNFRAILPIIEKQIEEADFITMDGEFTGLSDGRRINAFDTPPEYYETLRTGSVDFLLIQFGLCIFKWDANAKAFRHSGFNFYIFPGSSSKNVPEKYFQCQSSSMKFLAAQKFDFNKLFYDGIPYLSSSEEIQLKEKIEEKQKQERDSRLTRRLLCKSDDYIPIPDEDKSTIALLCGQLKEFMNQETKESLELNTANAFIRKLLYQEFERLYGNEISMETILDDNKRLLKVTKIKSEEDLQILLEKKHKEEWDNFQEAVGFSLIIRKLSESKKLLIGHCLLLDLLHILHQFFAPLPEDYHSFKEFANCTFPSIVDTMYLASIPELKDKIPSLNLESLLKTLSTYPFNMPSNVPENTSIIKGYSSENKKYHEAGYDAYITGLSFLSMAEYLMRQNKQNLNDVRLSSDSKFLKPYINKIFLFKTSFQDSSFINLSGNEGTPSRCHVFHLTFPTEWRRTEINELFSPFGGVYISFIDDNSAFVALRKRNLAAKVLKVLKKKHTPYKIIRYEDHKRRTSKNYYKYETVSTTSEDANNDSNSIIDGVNKLSGEDIGEPIPRESISVVVSDEKKELRRRSADVDVDPPKRRRTTSGVFEVDEGIPPIHHNGQGVFDENDDWK